MTVRAPADKRFRRAHVKPVRKRWFHLRALKLARLMLIVAAGGSFAYHLSVAMLDAQVLHVDRITVAGNQRLSRGEVLAVLTGLRGQNIIWADLEMWRRRLLNSPWVRDASVRRQLPATVEVTITEREPMAIGRVGRELYLIDDTGIIIDQYGPNYAEFDLPIVDGLATDPRSGGPLIDPARAALTARVIQAVRPQPDIYRRISQIDVSDLHDAVVILQGDPALLRVGEDQFLQRLESYVELAAALRERVAEIDYVDLRFDERVYVRPAGGISGRAARF
jgi:cell division septal protein FtsQ